MGSPSAFAFKRLTKVLRCAVPHLEHFWDSDSEIQLDNESESPWYIPSDFDESDSDIENRLPPEDATITQLRMSSPTEKISKLAPEIIYSIVKYLPQESAAVLSLTCRYFYYVLKEKYLEPLMEEWYDNPNFYNYLLLLEHDSPDHIACKECRRSHYVTEEVAHRYIRPDRDVIWHWRYDPEYYPQRSNKNGSWFFSAILFRKVMKQFQQKQKDIDCYLQLLSPKELSSPNSSTIKWQCSLAKVHQKELYIRRQTIWTPCPTEVNLQWYEDLCPHIYMWNRAYQIVFSCGVEDSTMIMSANPYSTETNDKLFQCQFCHTDYHVGFKKLDNKSLSLVCTPWHNLGEGKSALDTKLRRHTYTKYELQELRDTDEVNFEPESIKNTFERGGSQFGFNALLSSSETRDLLKINKELKKGRKSKVDSIRKCIGEFFNHRHDLYAGCKDPTILYNKFDERELDSYDIERLRCSIKTRSSGCKFEYPDPD
ncbi:hypothetical protein F5884DRAFT_902929 [Xylogone sp. PMI_703]|nr:hypothetical protein F5884DRAFT_902929 [Xylogone sp. PMI_703]